MKEMENDQMSLMRRLMPSSMTSMASASATSATAASVFGNVVEDVFVDRGHVPDKVWQHTQDDAFQSRSCKASQQ
jgi:hypothetical protein